MTIQQWASRGRQEEQADTKLLCVTITCGCLPDAMHQPLYNMRHHTCGLDLTHSTTTAGTPHLRPYNTLPTAGTARWGEEKRKPECSSPKQCLYPDLTQGNCHFRLFLAHISCDIYLSALLEGTKKEKTTCSTTWERWEG